MVPLLLTWWWVVPVALIAVYYTLRFVAERTLNSLVEGVMRESQAGFAKGDVEIHSITPTGTQLIDGEEARLYDIDATITPSHANVEWAAADLFLYGIDEEGEPDPMRIGEVRKVQHWDGSAFAAIKRSAKYTGPQRMKFSVRCAGAAGPTRFNYNFASFGPEFELPEAGVPVVT